MGTTKYKPGDVLFYANPFNLEPDNLCNWYIVFDNGYGDIEIRDLGNNNIAIEDEDTLEYKGTFLAHLDKFSAEDLAYHNLTPMLIEAYQSLRNLFLKQEQI